MTATRDELNAFLDLPEITVAHAQSGPLTGLTLGVKDIFDVAGYVTGCGNPDKAENSGRAKRTAPAVQSMLDAGAQFAGKTQTEELAFSMIGQNVHFAHPVNPKAPDRITGGSSSGSAAAVAEGLADIGTGSDTGGSVRAPASFCGLIGLRTTHGRISLDGRCRWRRPSTRSAGSPGTRRFMRGWAGYCSERTAPPLIRLPAPSPRIVTERREKLQRRRPPLPLLHGERVRVNGKSSRA